MLRLGFLHGSNDLYGASRVLEQDVSVLAQMGVDVVVVLPEDGPLTERLRSAGAHVAIERLAVLRRVSGARSVRVPTQLPECLERVDVVVVWTLALASYLPAAFKARKRRIASVHEILGGRAGALLGRGTSLLSNAVMVNSKSTAQWLTDAGAQPAKITLAYPEAPAYSPLPLPDRSSSEFEALLAGRVNGHKGHLEAVDAAETVRAAGVDFRLTLVGGSFPGQEVHLERLLERIQGLEFVKYLGEVTDVNQHLAAANAMLVPTTRPEPFGVVALEAWAAGRRVIASDEGGLAEATAMVEGVSFRARDSNALAEAILHVARSPELRQSPSGEAAVSRLCTAQARGHAWEQVLQMIGGARSDQAHS